MKNTIINLKDKNQLVYKLAYKYLLELKPPTISEDDLEKYFLGDRKDAQSLKDVFEQIIGSAQNYQAMPKIIKFIERKIDIKYILFDYDFKKIMDYEVDVLYNLFRKKFNITSKDSKQNSWRKWNNSIITAAKFMSDFTSIDDFKYFVKLFDYNLSTKIALPLLISTKISGMGFALACNCLKELGYTDYSKPDVHLIDIFYELGLSENKQIDVFEAIARMSDDCLEIDIKVTPYKIDKIMWLICSGRFYRHNVTIKNKKEEFIKMLKRHINCSKTSYR